MNKLFNSSGAIDPWFITGFTDAEGCFYLGIVRKKELKVGWQVKLSFQIGLHQKDKALLEQLKTSLGVGSVTKQGSQSIKFLVHAVEDLAVIIDHFDKYPLITQKRADYELFKKALNCINEKEHLSTEGLYKIVAIKASMNRGLSDELKAAFPNTFPVVRPLIQNLPLPDPQ